MVKNSIHSVESYKNNKKKNRVWKHLSTYYMDDLEELSRIDIGNLNRFIRSSEWFRDYGIADDCGSTINPMRPKSVHSNLLDGKPPLPTYLVWMHVLVYMKLEHGKDFFSKFPTPKGYLTNKLYLKFWWIPLILIFHFVLKSVWNTTPPPVT